MEQDIVSTVLWSWLVACGVWALNQYRQTRWEQTLLGRIRPYRARNVRLGLSVLYGMALVVIAVYWTDFSDQRWLLPMEKLDIPVLNQIGLLVLRIAVCWLIFSTMQRERSYRSMQHNHILDFLLDWEAHYNRQIAVVGAVLLFGLFLCLSGGVTASLCMLGWALGWRLWRVG